jgi:hypothetical protein
MQASRGKQPYWSYNLPEAVVTIMDSCPAARYTGNETENSHAPLSAGESWRPTLPGLFANALELSGKAAKSAMTF